MRSFCLCVGVFLGLVVPAKPSSAGEPLPAAAVCEAMQDRDYPRARKAIDEALRANDATADYLACLRVWSEYLEGHAAAALDAGRQFEQTHPRSPWLRRVRFIAGMARIQQGDFRAAEAIFESEARYLLSAERRADLGDIYREYGDRYFRPSADANRGGAVTPDYEKARKFYAKAREAGLRPAERGAVEMRHAECLQQLKQWDEAERAYARYCADHPDDAREPEARFHWGECLLAGQKPREARRVWRELLARGAGEKSPWTAESAFHLAETWQVQARPPRNAGDPAQAVAALEAFLTRFPTHELAGKAHLAIAHSRINSHQYEAAIAGLARFLADDRFQTSKQRPEACQLLGTAYHDKKKYAEALAAWREYLVRYPAQEAGIAIQQQIVDTEYQRAVDSAKAHDHAAALQQLGDFAAKYPLDPRCPAIQLLVGQVNVEQKQFEPAIAAWRLTATKYAHTEEATKARMAIAETLERILGRLDDALDEYRKMVAETRSAEAEIAVARLTQPSLRAAVAHGFRSNETPQLKLITRNLETVTVRIYKLDLEAYFRKMHSIEGVEKLDVGLIDPDVTFEFKVPGYAPHRELTSSIPVPLPAGAAAGAAAVTVSGEKLEATTLVLQSDLEVVVNSSPYGLFVFAENLRTGKPWPGVRLLVSDDQKVVEEAVTGVEGIFQSTNRKPRFGRHIRIYAAAGDHAAATAIKSEHTVEESSPVDDETPLAGYLYTDRPAYHPGETVRIRGCLRSPLRAMGAGKDKRADGEALVTLQCFDDRKRLLREQPVHASALGVFHTEFPLPEISLPDTYVLTAADTAGRSLFTTVSVYAEERPGASLAFDLPTNVYRLGDTIEGTITARSEGGVPLAGRQLQYHIADEPPVSATTNDRGEVHFRMPTVNLDSDGRIVLSANLRGESTFKQHSVYLDVGLSSIKLHSVREVYIAGEPIELSVKTIDSAVEPVAARLTLDVLKTARHEENSEPRTVDTRVITTADDGKTHCTVKLVENGAYIFRVTGTDRLNRVIRSEHHVVVSGGDDPQRLHVLTDQHIVSIGGTARPFIHWRNAPALALITYQGDTVLEHRIVELQTGKTALEIPVSDKFAPWFEVSVTVMSDALPAQKPAEPASKPDAPPPARFHHAACRIAVVNSMEVKLALSKGTAARTPGPGDPVEVTVTTRDAQGRPTPAELSLAFVPQSLFNRFRGQGGTIRSLIQPSTRDLAMETTSSITMVQQSGTRRANEMMPRAMPRRSEAPYIMGGGMGGFYIAPERGVPHPGDDPFSEPASRPLSQRERGDSAASVLATDAGPEPAPDPFGAPLETATAPARGPATNSFTISEPRTSGYWNPSIRTGADGKATVVLNMPAEAGAWRLVARGLSAAGIAGEAAVLLTVNVTEAAGKPQSPARAGTPVSFSASGAATGNATVSLAPPVKDAAADTLRILVSPSIDDELYGIAAGLPVACEAAGPSDSLGIAQVEAAAGDLLAAVAVRQRIKDQPASAARLPALDTRIQGRLAMLVLAQHGDGGWGWTAASDSDVVSTSRVVWALHCAHEAKYRAAKPCLDKSLGFLRTQCGRLDDSDYDRKAIAVHALSIAERETGETFAVANQLYRKRDSLSPVALAYLAAALAQMDHRPMADDVLAQLAKRGYDAATDKSAPTAGASGVEIRAVAALAMQKAGHPADASATALYDWLVSHRTAAGWRPQRGVGPAVLALCGRPADPPAPAGPCKLAVSLNGTMLQTVDLNPAGGTVLIEAPRDRLVAGKQSIEFRLSGRGRYWYRCVLDGVAPAESVVDRAGAWRVARRYEPGLLVQDDREIPRGYDIVADPTRVRTIHNPLTQLAVGRRAVVELQVSRANAEPLRRGTPPQWLVITDPLPAGTTVIQSSIRSRADRVEILPGRLVFYIPVERQAEAIRYEIEGCRAGRYSVAATEVYSADTGDLVAAGAAAPFTVVPPGTPDVDPYRFTPQELFELAQLAKAKGDLAMAGARLAELTGKWELNPDTYHRAVSMLFDVHVPRGPAAEIVHDFEIIKEKWPDDEVSFDKLLKVGAAYRDIGEMERSYLVYRAAIEASFTRESGVAGFLESEGEFLRSVDVMSRLMRDYPPEAYLAEAEIALAQSVYAKADEAASDPALVKAKIDRPALIRQAIDRFEAVLTAYPADALADQAAFADANAMLDLKDYRAAGEAAARAARRYPNSRLLDSYMYLSAYCDFALGRHEAAIDMCRKVAAARRLDPQTGQSAESENKWRAIYILGQIQQSLGRADEAIREYRRVEDRFADARQSIAWMQRKSITLPAQTTIRPDAPAVLDLGFRNLAACDVRVYRIDLMKFSQFYAQSDAVAQVNLAGIRPLYEGSVKLGDGHDYRDRTHPLALPLRKEGAYLVVCRGDDLHASGLLLITPLAIDARYETDPPQIRALVRDAATGRCVPGAQIKLVDSTGTGQAIEGVCDLRGVFTSKMAAPSLTVIAQAGAGRYAVASIAMPLFNPREMPEVARQEPRPAARQAQPADRPGTSVLPGRGPSRPGPVAAETPQRRPIPPPGRFDAVTVGQSGDADSYGRIIAALDSPTAFEFVETPLKDVVRYLKDLHKIPIEVDVAALKDAGVEPDKRVTIDLKGVSLRSALKHLLDECLDASAPLKHVIHNETLLITSQTKAESEEFLVTKIYPVEDVVLPDQAASEGEADFQPLIDLITNTVSPKTWQDPAGGPGALKEFVSGNRLYIVVSQTQEVHEEIGDLLGQIRKLNGHPGGSTQAGRPATSPAAPDRSIRLRRANPGPGMGGMGGGMMGGMMGGGFGGMGAGMGSGMMGGRNPPQTQQPAAGEDELLEGVKGSNRANQRMQTERLKRRYDSGQGMGGMGGGMNAGGVLPGK